RGQPFRASPAPCRRSDRGDDAERIPSQGFLSTGDCRLVALPSSLSSCVFICSIRKAHRHSNVTLLTDGVFGTVRSTRSVVMTRRERLRCIATPSQSADSSFPIC